MKIHIAFSLFDQLNKNEKDQIRTICGIYSNNLATNEIKETCKNCIRIVLKKWCGA